MKKLYILTTMLLLAIGITFFVSAYKKQKDEAPDGSGCSIGGFNAFAHYMFWVSKNYSGGAYTVKIFNDQGDDVSGRLLIYNKLSVFDTTPPDACNSNSASYAQHAVATLQYGHSYTYTVTSTNQSLSGKIVVPCDASVTCLAIQIDKQ